MKMQQRGQAAGVQRRAGAAAPVASVARSRAVVQVRAQAVAAPAATLPKEMVDKCVNAIRFLAIDAVNKSKSGHPGMPMGCAPMGYVLWNEVMKYNPKNPQFFNRDRFVLSAGHGSMFQYSMLHLTGYESVTVRTRMGPWGRPRGGGECLQALGGRPGRGEGRQGAFAKI